jgi:hypothetical protein
MGVPNLSQISGKIVETYISAFPRLSNQTISALENLSLASTMIMKVSNLSLIPCNTVETYISCFSWIVKSGFFLHGNVSLARLCFWRSPISLQSLIKS